MMNIVLKNAENDEYKQDEKHEDDETDGEVVDFREICDKLTFTAYKMKNTP